MSELVYCVIFISFSFFLAHMREPFFTQHTGVCQRQPFKGACQRHMLLVFMDQRSL